MAPPGSDPVPCGVVSVATSEARKERSMSERTEGPGKDPEREQDRREGDGREEERERQRELDREAERELETEEANPT